MLLNFTVRDDYDLSSIKSTCSRNLNEENAVKYLGFGPGPH